MYVDRFLCSHSFVAKINRSILSRYFLRKYQKVIRNRKLKKDRQYNGKQKDEQRSTNSTQKPEDRATRT